MVSSWRLRARNPEAAGGQDLGHTLSTSGATWGTHPGSPPSISDLDSSSTFRLGRGPWRPFLLQSLGARGSGLESWQAEGPLRCGP